MRIFRYLLTFSLSFAFVFAAGCSDPKPDYSEFYKPQPGDEPEDAPGEEEEQPEETEERAGRPRHRR